MSRITRILIFILGAAIGLNAQELSGRGTGVAAFLKRGMSARAIGMGSAYTATVIDPSAVFWNPAGLLSASGFQLQITDMQDLFEMNSFGDINYPQIALSYSFKRPVFDTIYFAAGSAVSGFLVKDIDRYDDFSNYMYSFNYGEYAIFFSIALKIRLFRIGMTWKFIEQNFGLKMEDQHFIQNNSTSLLTKPHDIGIMFEPIRFMTVGLIIRDSLRIGRYDVYPRNTQLGVKFNINAQWPSLPNIIVASDLINTSDSFNKFNAGVEYQYSFADNLTLAIRAGSSNIALVSDSYFSNLEENVPFYINTKGALGIGLKWQNFTFDLALVQELQPTLQTPYSRLMVLTFSFIND